MNKNGKHPGQNNLKKYPIGSRSAFSQYLSSAIITGLAVLLCSPLSNSVHYHIVSYILLFQVLFLSTFLGVGPVLMAAALSALTWNFFFIPPHLTFHIDKMEDILIFGLFFIIALVSGVMTSRIRHQEMLARERETRTNALFTLSRDLSGAGNTQEVIAIAVNKIWEQFGINAYFILQDGEGNLDFKAWGSEKRHLTTIEKEIAESLFHMTDSDSITKHGILPGSEKMILLRGTRINPGIMIIRNSMKESEEEISFRETFTAQISNALEREFLSQLARKAQFLAESDRLYKTLFNSISHELRIPVAAIMGASDSILNVPAESSLQKELFSEIFTASRRLNRLIENLLNMSRLESGRISVKPDWHDINDLVNKVTRDLEDELRPFTLSIRIPDSMPPVFMDFGLMEQVLYNLLYNAAQYAPVASVIELKAASEGDNLLLELSDRGPGFSEADLPHLFEKFYRASGSKTGGLGLGLSIAKGFTEAHHGTLIAGNYPDGGAWFKLQIPSGITEIRTFKAIEND
ncbi:MAG TPA: DUF4118 domain-containing protein [Lentimicrobium sp.]|nr:DUF4118 domain-containing protein [Lentimicrobium sp.]